jgi:hypothetical protein
VDDEGESMPRGDSIVGLERSLLDAALGASAVAGTSDEAVAFRSRSEEIADIGAAATLGVSLGRLNYPAPRVLGDLNWLKKLEIIGALPAAMPPVKQRYLQALAAVTLPILGMEAVACQFPDIYFPDFLVDERLLNPTEETPFGIEKFTGKPVSSGILDSDLPRCLSPFLPIIEKSTHWRRAWTAYRDSLRGYHSRGSELRAALQEVLASLGSLDVTQRARTAVREARGDREIWQELQQIIQQFHSRFPVAFPSGITLDNLNDWLQEFVESSYKSSGNPRIKVLVDSIRAFERHVWLAKAFVAQATMRWPFVDIVPYLTGPIVDFSEGDQRIISLYLRDFSFAHAALPGDIVQIGDKRLRQAGFCFLRFVQWSHDSTGNDAWHFELEWLGPLQS